MAPAQIFLDGKVELRPGDCRDVIKAMPDCSVDSVVTDPPYALVSIVKRYGKEESHLHVKEGKDLETIAAAQYKRLAGGFMGKQWDTGETAFATEFWAEVLRVLKPGGHVVAFSGTRTYHRMAVAIEDAGFEIRDQIGWLYGSGFPKSHDVSKGIDKAAGAVREVVGKSIRHGGGIKGAGTSYEVSPDVPDITAPATPAAREWQGWGTALKPAWEPICLARKPLIGTVAANVLERGTGALNIDGCRVGDTVETWPKSRSYAPGQIQPGGKGETQATGSVPSGRWPANIVHDGSDEVLAGFPETGAAKAGGKSTGRNFGQEADDEFAKDRDRTGHTDNGGSAARFFYTAKADKGDRMGSKHPTVKPVDLMQWLCRMVTPPGGVVLDPFAGSGSTGEAAWREGFRCILIEREEEYQADIAARLNLADKGPATRKARSIKQTAGAGPLFGDAANDNGGGRAIYGKFADQQPGWRNNGR